MAIHNNSITIAKALGIILMVIGHSVCPVFLSRFIYLFHMPLFFFCSGLFFTQPTKYEDVKKYTKKRIEALYFPFITWSFIFILCHNMFLDIHIYYYKDTSLYHFSDYINKTISIIFTMSDQEPIIFQFWFLKQLLLSSAIVSCISYILNYRNIKTNKVVNLCTLLLSAIISKHINLQLPIIGDLSLLLLSTTFFYSGVISKKIIKYFENKTAIGLVCLIILLSYTYLTQAKIEMLNYTYKNTFTYYILAQLGIFMLLLFSKYLEDNFTSKTLYYIGNHTMVIFIWHLLSFRLASLIKISIFGYPINRIGDFKIIANDNEYFWIVYTIIGISVPLLLLYCISKIEKKISQ